jgi:hypothetical protein
LISTTVAVDVIVDWRHFNTMSDVTETQLRARFAEVKDLIGKYEIALAYLRQEFGQLEIVVNVLDRFDKRPDYSRVLPPTWPTEPTVGFALSNESKKPAGTPTMPEMIEAVLTEASFQGRHALEPKEIVATIRQKWWPTVTPASVSPIAWRLAKEGRLHKDGSKYSLAREQAAESPDEDSAEISLFD